MHLKMLREVGGLGVYTYLHIHAHHTSSFPKTMLLKVSRSARKTTATVSPTQFLGVRGTADTF